MKVITRKILTTGGLDSKEPFTHSLETLSTIALWHDNLICWFDKRTYSKITEIRGKVLSCKRTFIIAQENRIAVFGLHGNEIIPFRPFSYVQEHYYAIEAKTNDTFYAYSYDGKQLLTSVINPLVFTEHGISIKTGLCKKGLHSYEGTTIIPSNYTILSLFSNGIMCSNEDRLFGVFSYTGKIIVPFEYDSLTQYTKCILASKDKMCGMLSNDGKVLIPFNYDNISELSDNNEDFFIVEKNSKYGLYNYDGNEILNISYEKITYEEDEYLIITQDGYDGLYYLKGVMLLKPIYEDITYHGDSIFRVKSAGGVSYYIAAINRTVYATDVICCDNVYLALIDGTWTFIED